MCLVTREKQLTKTNMDFPFHSKYFGILFNFFTLCTSKYYNKWYNIEKYNRKSIHGSRSLAGIYYRHDTAQRMNYLLKFQ